MNKKSRILLLASLLTLSSANAEEDVTQEIMDRCRSSMGEYGAAMVKACVDRDLKALPEIHKYASQFNAIVSRCTAQMREYGFAMVLACAERDIKAEEALSNY